MSDLGLEEQTDGDSSESEADSDLTPTDQESGWKQQFSEGMVVGPSSLVWITVAAGYWLTRGLYRSGLPPGADMPYHAARNAFGFSELFSHGHLDGWSPLLNGGSQFFLLYGPGLAMLAGLGRVLTFGQMSNETLLSVIAGISIAAVGPAMYLLARSLRISPLGSAIVGCLSLTISVPFGVGLSGTFVNGLLPNQVAAPFFILTLVGVVKLSEGPSDRWLLGTAASAAAVIAIHLPSVPSLALAALVLVGLGRIREPLSIGSYRRLGFAAFLTAGATTWLWASLLENSGPRPPLATWGTAPFGTRMHDMGTGRDWTHPAVAAIATLALAVVVIRLVAQARDQPWLGRWAWSIALSGPLLLGLVQVLHDRVSGDLGVSIAIRTLGYGGLLFLLPIGVAADLLLGSADLGADGSNFKLKPRHAVLLGLAGLPAFFGWVPAFNSMADRREPAPALVAAAETLKATMAPQDRFAWIDEPGFSTAYGQASPAMWLVMKTGLSSMNGLAGNQVTPINAYLADSLLDKDPAEVTQLLDRAAVNVVLASDVTAQRLLPPPDWKKLSSSDGLTIVQRQAVNRLAQPSGPDGAQLKLARWSNESIDWTVERGGGATVLAVPAFPKWTVRVDGRTQPALQTDGYLWLDVPVGAKQVTARFERTAVDRLGLLASMLALLLGGYWLGGAQALHKLRSRRRST